MQSTNKGFNHRTQQPSESNVQRFSQTLGGTTYTVSVYFNPHSKEKFEDKILRMLRSEEVNIA